MTVEASPLVTEKTIAPVSAVQYSVPRRSAYPVQMSTTGSPCRYTASAPPPYRRPGNNCENARAVQAKLESAAPWIPCGSATLHSRSLTPVTMY